MADFDNIYNEQIALIASYLTPRDLIALQIVCKSLNNKVQHASILQPLYNRLYQIDKTLLPLLDPNNPFLCFKNAFEKIRARQEAEIDFLVNEHGTLPDELNIAIESINDLEKRDILLNNLNILLISIAIGNQPATKLSLSGITRFIMQEDMQEYYTHLEKLDCSDNLLAGHLDLTKLISLKEVSCYGNQLTSLTVEGCTHLQDLYCGRNPLVHVNMNQCFLLQNVTITQEDVLKGLKLQFDGVSQVMKEKLDLDILKEKALFEELKSPFSDGFYQVKALGKKYNPENCQKYGCTFQEFLIVSEDEDMLKENKCVTFTPMMNSFANEGLMDEDRLTDDKRKREEPIDKSEEPEFKRRKKDSF